MISSEKAIHIHVFGSLRRHLAERGLPWTMERRIPAMGSSALEVAGEIPLPPEEIEAVFRNGRVINIHDSVYPGDRLSFFPYGTPGPYRIFLGMARENIRRAQIESKS